MKKNASRRPPLRDVLVLGASHAFALALALIGGWSYPMLQLTFGVEIALVGLASYFLNPAWGVLRTLGDLLKTSATTAFLFAFVWLTYRETLPGGRDDAAAIAALDPAAAASAAFYVAVSLGVSVIVARRSADPRLTWTKTRIATNGSNFFAMFGMVFVTIFLAKPALEWLRAHGVHPGVDAVLITAMIALRYGVMLVVSTFSERDWETIARQTFAA